MQRLNSSSPDPLKCFVSAQLVHSRYRTVAKSVPELFLANQQYKVEEQLEALLLLGPKGE
jgi:hypothetical protein